MPYIFLCQMLAFEYMAKMSPAVGAFYFSPMPIWIGNPFYRAFYLIVEAGPAAMRIEFVLRTV